MPPLRRAVPVALLLVLACETAGPRALPTAPPSATGGQVVRVAVASLPGTLDPALAPAYDSGASRLMFETLVRPKADLSALVPAAAQSWDLASDDVTYDFRLRRGARWSDGRAVRAADFLYSWRRLLDPRVNSPAAEVLSPLVKGAGSYGDLDPRRDATRIPAFLDGLAISAPDEATFRVVLDHPSAEFLWAAAMPGTAPERGDSPQLGNGPFRLGTQGPEQIAFERNERYWGPPSHLARIVLIKRGDQKVDLERFQRGEEEITSLGSEVTAAVAENPALSTRLVRTPALAVWWVQFNVHRAPLDRPVVRRALAQAIDRDRLVGQVLKGAGLGAASLLPKGMTGYRPGLAAQRFNPAAARAALDSSGAPAAELGSLRMLVRDLAPDRAVAGYFAAQVKENLGLAISLDIEPSPAVTKKLAVGDFQLAGPSGWIADVADPQDLLDLFLTEVFRGQASRFSNPAFDKLVTAGDREPNPVRRLEYYAQAQQLLVEEAPVAFLYQPQVLALRSATLSGFVATGLDDWPGDLFANELARADR